MKTSGLILHCHHFGVWNLIQFNSMRIYLLRAYSQPKNQMRHWWKDSYHKVPAQKSSHCGRGDKQYSISIMQITGGQDPKGWYDGSNIPVLNKRKPWFWNDIICQRSQVSWMMRCVFLPCSTDWVNHWDTHIVTLGALWKTHRTGVWRQECSDGMSWEPGQAVLDGRRGGSRSERDGVVMG